MNTKNLTVFGLAFLLSVVTACTAPVPKPAEEPNELPKPMVAERNNWTKLEHKFFTVYYDSKIRLPRYVIHEVTAEHLKSHIGKRKNNFRADPLLGPLNLKPVKKDDYTGTGYDRGHMAPFADFSFDQNASDETFVMTNMAPQSKGLNEHAWEQLEEQVRAWPCGEGRVKVITGPIIEPDLPSLGKTGIPIPKDFFKIIIDETPPVKAIGFVYHQSDDSKVKFKDRVEKLSLIEARVHEDFESNVVKSDRHIFTDESKFEEWKSANCK